METSTIGKSYSDRMQLFVTDPELQSLDLKYDPYLEIHEMDDVLTGCDIVQISTGDKENGKLVWNTEYDLPTELKRDIISLFNKHFAE
ncbi:MAG: hypothetical protein JWP94_642 [Mucilaginibacter sp.]|nr:hypothetical protein [Mucilaginibacter sp.]